MYDNVVLRTLGSPQAALLFGYVDNVDVRRNVSRVATTQSRMAVRFQDARGLLTVLDNDFAGACMPYVSDLTSSLVVATGNILSIC